MKDTKNSFSVIFKMSDIHHPKPNFKKETTPHLSNKLIFMKRRTHFT